MSNITSPKSLTPFQKRNNEVQLFKLPNAPPIKRPKRRAKVLDEDTYVEEMAKIIQRDFFPDLEKLKAQNDFLDATEQKDHQKLRELYIKYSGGQRPPTERYASPATFETPHNGIPGTPTDLSHDPLEPSSHRSRSRNNNSIDNASNVSLSNKHTLDSYLASYTSEDNDSFQDLMDDMEQRNKAKFAGQLQIEHESQLEKLAYTVVPSIEAQADQTKKSDDLVSWSYTAKNHIMYVPDGQPAPEVSVTHQRQISHTNTRFENDPFDYKQNKEAIAKIAKSQEKVLSGKIGVDGSTLLDNKTREKLSTGSAGLETSSDHSNVLLSMLNPHGFVRTPSPCPGAPGESPLMTWGEIEGTPFRLDGGDTPLPGKGSGTSFKMADTSKREQIALALAEKAGQRHRAQKLKAMEAAKRSILTPSPRLTPGTTVDRLASMSPAAQRLATTQLRRHFSSISTPSPKTTPRSARSLTPLIANSRQKSITPVSTRRRHDIPISSSSTDDKRSKNNLTDDLLQINVPKRSRSKAADFFQ